MGSNNADPRDRGFIRHLRNSVDLSFFNSNKNFNLLNYDQFLDMLEDFPIVDNSYVNLNTLPRFQKKKYVVLSVNIFSLSSKFNDLASYIDSLTSKNITIIALLVQETWGANNVFSFPNFKFDYINRTNRSGGGVAIYANCNYKPKFKNKIMIVSNNLHIF